MGGTTYSSSPPMVTKPRKVRRPLGSMSNKRRDDQADLRSPPNLGFIARIVTRRGNWSYFDSAISQFLWSILWITILFGRISRPFGEIS